MVGAFFLWFQGRSKSSTNTNILTGFDAINPSRDFYLQNKKELIVDAKIIESNTWKQYLKSKTSCLPPKTLDSVQISGSEFRKLSLQFFYLISELIENR